MLSNLVANQKRILEKRAKKDGRSNDEKIPKTKTEVMNTIEKFMRSTMARPLHMLLTEPIPGLFSLYVAFNFSIMYCFFVAFPIVFETVYGFDHGLQGLTFFGLGVGVLIAIIIIILNSKYIYAPRAARWKKQHAQEHGDSKTKSAAPTPPPEWRLFIAFPGSILLPVSLFLFAWTARPLVHWIVPVIAEALFGIGQVLIFMAATMYIMDTYGPLYGASAMAANGLLRYVMGSAFPLFAQQMYSALGVAWATSLLGFVSIVLTLIPWCFWIWGPNLRGMSKYQHGA
jgi:hypothetical protein